MITREADYALRVMLYLAQQPAAVASSAGLAEAMDIPYRFLRKIVRRLVAAKLLVSQRGRTGGICLAAPAKQLSLRQALSAVDPGGIALNLCVREKPSCSRHSQCAIHRGLQAAQAALDKALADVNFAQLVKNFENDGKNNKRSR